MNQISIADVERQRSTNLRQRLLRASRAVNRAIVSGLHERGFPDLRSTHTALLSNLDMQGGNMTTVAQRAGMSKQAMGRLSEELVQLGYIRRRQDEQDARAVKLEFTKAGMELMEQSFIVMRDIETRCEKTLGVNIVGLSDVLDKLARALDSSAG